MWRTQMNPGGRWQGPQGELLDPRSYYTASSDLASFCHGRRCLSCNCWSGWCWVAFEHRLNHGFGRPIKHIKHTAAPAFTCNISLYTVHRILTYCTPSIVYTHACMHTYVRTYVRTYIRMYVRTHIIAAQCTYYPCKCISYIYIYIILYIDMYIFIRKKSYHMPESFSLTH